MISRILGAGLVVASLGNAPLQCGSGPDPGTRLEDTAGDALYALAQDFRAKGNEQAARDTLRYLVDHYPSNRHVPGAKAELEGTPPTERAAPASSTTVAK